MLKFSLCSNRFLQVLCVLYLAMFVANIAPKTALAESYVSELPINSDYCSILRAMTNADDPSCPLTHSALTRSTGNAATTGFSRGAAPLSSKVSDTGYFIRFAFNSIDLTPEYKSHLDRLSSVFKSSAMEGVCVKLVGHTDVVGASEYNQRLSLSRARIVMKYLTEMAGVDNNKLQAGGAGESKPLLNIPGGHPLNRRVEILAKSQSDSACN